MALFTIITRLSDGLPLVESTDPIPIVGADVAKQQAKAILKRLDSRSPTRLSVESGPYIFSYVVEDGVACLVMTDAKYPKRLTFAYLHDLQREFVEYVRSSTPGGDAAWRARVDTAAQAYAFLGFAKVLSRLRRDYADPESKSNAAKLAEELYDVQAIMRANIGEVLDRGEKLEHVSKVSSRLVSESKRFKWGAKKLNLWDKYKQLAPVAGAGLVVLLVLWWRFF